MDGAVPGKIKDQPVLVWNLQTLMLQGGTIASYAIVSDANDGTLETVNAELVSMDWRLVDGAWVPLYDDGTEEEDTDGSD
jgi:hypothetical protein